MAQNTAGSSLYPMNHILFHGNKNMYGHVWTVHASFLPGIQHVSCTIKVSLSTTATVICEM